MTTTHSTNPEKEEQPKGPEILKIANALDLYFLGITIVIGGQAFSWNAGLNAGFWEFFICTAVVGIAYGCLVLCLSEMVSAVTFSGGLYGMVRVSISPYVGFLVGCCEMVQNILYVSSSVIPFGWIMSIVFNTSSKYEPLYWLLFFSTAIAINHKGGIWMWNFNRIAGIFCLFLIVLYIISITTNEINFNHYAIEKNQHNSSDKQINFLQLLRSLPLATWFYIGVELIPFAALESKTPTKSLPRSMISCYLTLLLTAFAVYFTACSQSPGTSTLVNALFPLASGYANMLGISTRMATIFAIPLTYTTAYGFLFGCGRQMTSLSSSGLIPFLHKHRHASSSSSYTSLLFGSFISLLSMCIIHYALDDDVMILFYICILGSVFIYINVLISFIVFKLKYKSLKREFNNPLGVMSAIVGIVIFGLIGISILGLQNDSHASIAPVAFGIIIVIGTIYYMLYANKRQFFSEEEQKAFLITYIINSNAKGRKRLKGGLNSKENSFTDSFLHRSISRIGGNLSNRSSNNSVSISRPTSFNRTKPVHRNTNKVVPISNNNVSQIEDMEVINKCLPEKPHKPEEDILVIDDLQQLEEGLLHEQPIDFDHLPDIHHLYHNQHHLTNDNDEKTSISTHRIAISRVPRDNYTPTPSTTFENKSNDS